VQLPVQRLSKNSSIPGKCSAQSNPANYAGVREAPVWQEADAHATVERCVVDCGRCKSLQGIVTYALLRFPRWREGERDPQQGAGNKTIAAGFETTHR